MNHWPLKEWKHRPAQHVFSFDVHLLTIFCHQRAGNLVVSGGVVHHRKSQQAQDQHTVVVVEWMQLLMFMRSKTFLLDFSMAESGLVAGYVKEYFEPGHSHLSLCLKRFIFCPSFFHSLAVHFITHSHMPTWSSSKKTALSDTWHHTQSHAHLKYSFEEGASGDIFHHTESNAYLRFSFKQECLQQCIKSDSCKLTLSSLLTAFWAVHSVTQSQTPI